MLDQEAIDQQLTLLEAHRRTLTHSLEQYHALGVLTPSALVHSIREAWTRIAQIKTSLRAHGVDVTDDPVDEPRELHITVPTLTPTERRNRQRMLQKVRDFWIKGVLENSLHGAALIELGMEYKPDAVQHPWDMVIQQPEQATRSIPSGTKIIDVFDEIGGELLILGAPGSGKTTMLLELARDLIKRAEQDETYPIPVIFNLSSWTEKRKPLVEWLVDELNVKYDVPRKIGKAWVDGDQVLPLLDGLDEIVSGARDACVEIINLFRHDHGLVSLSVCSRATEYETLTTRLKLENAVLIEPLTIGQMDTYLSHFDDRLGTLRAALIEDTALQELAVSPLMLTVMAAAYRDMSIKDISEATSREHQDQFLLETYVNRMLTRRGIEQRYQREETIHWLSCLANGLQRQDQTIFLLERLQASWLVRRSYLYEYALLDRLGTALIGILLFGTTLWMCLIIANHFLFGLFINLDVLAFSILGGVAFGLSSGINTIYTASSQRLKALAFDSMVGGILTGVIGIIVYASISPRGFIGGLTFGLFGGLFFGIAGGPETRPRSISLTEQVKWSWSRAAQSFSVFGLAGTIGGGIVGYLSGGMIPGLAGGRGLLAGGLIGGLGGGLVGGLLQGMVVGEVQARTSPNQGLKQSARNAAVMASLSGISGSLVVLLAVMPIVGPYNSFSYAIIFALIVASAAGLSFGGNAVISHFALRFVLWSHGAMPLNYIRFLDYCADRILLRKVGGGYIFIHRMLMEYFASLDDTETTNAEGTNTDGRTVQA